MTVSLVPHQQWRRRNLEAIPSHPSRSSIQRHGRVWYRCTTRRGSTVGEAGEDPARIELASVLAAMPTHPPRAEAREDPIQAHGSPSGNVPVPALSSSSNWPREAGGPPRQACADTSDPTMHNPKILLATQS